MSSGYLLLAILNTTFVVVFGLSFAASGSALALLLCIGNVAMAAANLVASRQTHRRQVTAQDRTPSAGETRA